MIIWHMGIACWIPKATDAYSGCVILIAFPLQQWLHKRTSVLHYTHNACLVYTLVSRHFEILELLISIAFFLRVHFFKHPMPNK